MGALVVVSLDSDITICLHRGRNNGVFYRYKVNGTWKPDRDNQIPLQHILVASDMVAVARGSHVNVFVIDFDSNVQYLTWEGIDGCNAQWRSLGGPTLCNVAGFTQGSERLYVFSRQADDNALYFKTHKNGAWNPTWQYLGHISALGSAAAVAPSPSRIMVLTCDHRNALRTKRGDGSSWILAATEVWEALSGMLFIDVAAAMPPDDDDRCVKTFYLGTNGAMHGQQWDGGQRQPFFPLSGNVVARPSVFLSSDRLDLYALSASNTIVTKRRAGSLNGQWDAK